MKMRMSEAWDGNVNTTQKGFGWLMFQERYLERCIERCIERFLERCV